VRGGLEKADAKGRSAGLSQESAVWAFKPDAAPARKEPKRDHIRLRGVG